VRKSRTLSGWHSFELNEDFLECPPLSYNPYKSQADNGSITRSIGGIEYSSVVRSGELYGGLELGESDAAICPDTRSHQSTGRGLPLTWVEHLRM
jgi:hypothetical protein